MQPPLPAPELLFGGGRRAGSDESMERRTPWPRTVMMLPTLVFFAAFVVIPMAMAVYYSFLRWNGIGQPQWTGGANWAMVFHDPQALHAMWLTLAITVLSWVIQTPLSLWIGVFLAGRQRYKNVFGILYFTPLLFSAAAIGITWSYILNPNFGLVLSLLKALGFPADSANILGNPRWALFTVACVVSWQFIPFHSLLYQSGSRQIPETLYEAAKIDGAGPWRMFFSITLPQLKYTVITSTVLILTGSLTYFDLIYVLTGGGPGDATNVLAMDMYKQAFVNQNVGYGSVLAVILAVVGVGLSLVMLRLTGYNRMDSQLEGV
ncbi:raffinose/stachyose/melibiose transport system permease protein [Alicyclobacillus macrosporangiidus]|uniref:Raffinose/stachyose/melibiose transport system permease protein n=2 Tax=Alicyclobacillus macrosporangiidus TaxID=392015 RepID=A0A1I7GAA6_9BACL|nr:raffinose/stachyose/melibiose transport system permease protein [Alicyclobacillus macrosporangiidus]